MKHRREFTTWTGADDGLPKKPLLNLRIFAEGNPRRFFVEVYVWEFLYQMRGVHRGKNSRKTLAFWNPTYEARKVKDKRGRDVISKKLGEIHLPLAHCTYNTIAHEAYHATRYFALRSKNIEPASLEESDSATVHWMMPEEVNARFHGYLTNEIIAQVLDFINSRRPVPCGEATHMRDSPDDSGKARFCERPKGHTGKHSAHYCGKRRYWKNAGHDKSVHTAKPNPKPK